MAKPKNNTSSNANKLTFGKRKKGSAKKILQQTYTKTESLCRSRSIKVK